MSCFLIAEITKFFGYFPDRHTTAQTRMQPPKPSAPEDSHSAFLAQGRVAR